MDARITRPPRTLRILASLLALFVLLALGCAPRMKADVQAVSAPGFRKAGQSYVLVPGAALTTLSAVNADMFRQSTQRLRAVLTGHGYREAASPEVADLAVVVEWKVDGPHEAPDLASGYSRPSVGIGIGYGSWPWYGGAYGSRNSGWGYGGYRGFGGGYGYPPPMTVVHTRTLSIEARDLRTGRTEQTERTGLTGLTGLTGQASADSAAASATGSPVPASADPTGQGMTGQAATGQATTGQAATGQAAPDRASTASPALATPQPAPARTPPNPTEVPEYARPPYGTPIGVVQGLPSPSEMTGPVVWKVVVSSTGSSRDIQSALPALTVAASRWIGVTTNVKVTVDDELNVTIQGQ